MNVEAEAALLELTGVTKDYGGLAVLRGIDLTVAPGESLAIVGPSGSGKSTLLNLLGALDTPTAGTARFEGRDIAALTAMEAARFRNRQVGFVFQLHHLLPQCSVMENVLVPALVEGVTEAARDRAARLLGRVGLGERLDHRPGELSGGERQRVAVVRALINGPALLLADEPTGSLSEDAAADLAGLMLELNREEGMALIVVTHSSAIAKMMGRVIHLHEGRLEESAS